MGVFSFLNKEIAIDLGTANTIIIYNDKVVVDEPSIVAMQRDSKKKDLVFKVRERHPENLLCVIGSVLDNKPTLNVMLSDDLVNDRGLNAGQLVREAAKLMQGGGGGQPHFASAGGKNVDGLSAAMDKVIELANL